MKTSRISILLALLAASALRAQVVNDGETNTLSNVTNTITGDVTVGTNGSFTLLILSDNALLTNSVNGLLGRNNTANSNEVQLVSPSARWFMGGSLFVGTNGGANRFLVSNSATVLVRGSGTLGYGGDFSGNANSNSAMVSGSGSLWSNGVEMVVGELGFANRLEVNDGGRVFSSNGVVGRSLFSPSNTVVVTGPGSVWSNRAGVTLGGVGSRNLLVISNGGWMVNSNANIGESSLGNLALVTGNNSTWSNRGDLFVGNNARENQLVVSNGAVVVNGIGLVGNNTPSSNNAVVVKGVGSFWSNRQFMIVGEGGGGNTLEISGGGKVYADSGTAGDTSSGNLALITGPGSLWTNRFDLTVGYLRGGNQMVISNGGTARSADGYVGRGSSGTNCQALVTGAGSVWDSVSSFNLGGSGSRNLITVESGGLLADNTGVIGINFNGTNNLALITGPGSAWSNRLDLQLGQNGSANQLVVSNGALVYSGGNGAIGISGIAGSNSASVTGAGSIWTNRLDLLVGQNGSGNRLVVSDAAVASAGSECVIGVSSTANSNSVLVTDSGSQFLLTSSMLVGSNGSLNRLTLSNGGFVSDAFGLLGASVGGSNNEVVVSGPGSIWSNRLDCRVGDLSPGNRLVISNGGTVFADLGYIGFQPSSSSNLVLVTGPGSTWTNADDLVIGDIGPGNRLVVSNGGKVQNLVGFIGLNTPSSNNTVLVTGPGSQWTMPNGAIFVSISSSVGNQLVISNGGLAFCGLGWIGFDGSPGPNEAIVTGPGSLWNSTNILTVGRLGSRNRLVVSNAALAVGGSSIMVGESVSSVNNRIVVDGGTLRTTNASGNAFFDVRRGTNVLNAGLVEADRLLLTNKSVTVGPTNFGNAISIGIPSGGTPIQYPSTITVTGVGGGITKITATLSNLSHTFPADLDILLVSPAGQKVMLMSDVGDGAGTDLVNARYTFDDAAGSILFANAPNGSYRPADNSPGETMPSPAPAGPYSTTLSSFNGASPNGTWSLYIADDFNPDSGNLSGWGLTITTEIPGGFFEFNGGTLITRSALINNGTNFSVGNSGTTPASWHVLAGASGHFVTNNLTIGESTSFNQLFVTNGALLQVGSEAAIGLASTANSNAVTIAGTGSRWSVGDSLTVGTNGSNNRLVISNSASVFDLFGTVGYRLGSRSNLAVVTGSGSLWSNAFDLSVGIFDAGNRLEISNGAVALSEFGILGFNAGSGNNSALVTGAGSTWSITTELWVGRAGAGNQLVVSNGALVSVGGTAFLGISASSTNNRIIVDGGTISVTNVAGTGMLDIRRGTNVLNAGLIEADILRVTNGASGRFELNGGTLSIKSSRVSAGNPLLIGDGVHPATLNLAGDGTHDFSGTPSLIVRSNATLTGNGSLIVQLQVQPGAELIPGASAGKISLSTPPFFAGTIVMEIRKKSTIFTNDQIQVTGTLTYGGTLVVSNISLTALAPGDRFKLFDATSYAGAFSSIILPPLDFGLTWTNKLLVDGSIEVLPGPAILMSGGSYTQNFDSLTLGGRAAGVWQDNSTLLGWYAAQSLAPFAITNYRSSDGSTNSGGLYSFGSNGTSERALGSIPVNAMGHISYGLGFINDTGNTVTNCTIAYTGEQWRDSESGVTNTLSFWYQVSPTAITNPEPGIFTNWTEATGLNFVSPTVLGVASALDGNQATNRRVFASVFLPGISIPPGHHIFFRWHDSNDSGSDEGMALDDLVVTFPLPAEKFWTNALGGNYEAGSNWLANAVATHLDTANFTNNASYQVSWLGNTQAARAFFNAQSGTVTQAIGSSTWTVTDAYIVGKDSATTSAVTHTSGTLRVTNSDASATLVIGKSGRGNYTLSGGAVEVDNLFVTNGTASRFTLFSGSLKTRNTSFNQGTSFEVGNFFLTGTATLELLGNGTHSFPNAVTVYPNATLKGNGSIAGSVFIMGLLSPGASIGQIAISRSLAFDFDSTAFFELNKAAGTNDNIVGLTNVQYQGTLIVTNLAGTLANGDRFPLFVSTRYFPSAFTNIVLPPLDPGLKWRNKLMMDGSLEVLTIPTRDFGVDVSHFQGADGIPQLSWNQMFADGKRFAFIKATEGLTGPHDAAMSNNVERATAAGLLAGVYHFAHPENRPTTAGAILEASNMVVYAGSAIGPGRLRPVLDIEGAATSLSVSALTDWVIAFCDEIIARRGPGAAPIIYCTQGTAILEFDSRLATYDLWVRTIGGSDPATDDPVGVLNFDPTGVFNEWSFWQYSDTGSSGGIGPLDLDVCHSEYKPLASYIIPSSPTPTPIQLGALALTGSGVVQFSFTNTPGALFTVLAATNPTLPLINWTVLGAVTEGPPGQFQFTDPQATNNPQRYYRVRSP